MLLLDLGLGVTGMGRSRLSVAHPLCPHCHPFVETFPNPTSPGAWYFYPYGLSTHSFPAFPWWGAGRLSSSSSPSFGERDVTALDQVNHPKEEALGGNGPKISQRSFPAVPASSKGPGRCTGGLHGAFPSPPQGLRGEQRLLARFQALEKRFEALEAEVSRWELRRGAAAAGSEPPPGDILGLLEGLLSRREAGMKEQLRGDVAGQLQVRGVRWIKGVWGCTGMGSDVPSLSSPRRGSWTPCEPRCRGTWTGGWRGWRAPRR